MRIKTQREARLIAAFAEKVWQVIQVNVDVSGFIGGAVSAFGASRFGL